MHYFRLYLIFNCYYCYQYYYYYYCSKWPCCPTKLSSRWSWTPEGAQQRGLQLAALLWAELRCSSRPTDTPSSDLVRGREASCAPSVQTENLPVATNKVYLNQLINQPLFLRCVQPAALKSEIWCLYPRLRSNIWLYSFSWLWSTTFHSFVKIRPATFFFSSSSFFFLLPPCRQTNQQAVTKTQHKVSAGKNHEKNIPDMMEQRGERGVRGVVVSTH